MGEPKETRLGAEVQLGGGVKGRPMAGTERDYVSSGEAQVGG